MSRLTRRQVVQGTGALGLGLLAGCSWLPGQAPSATKVWRIGLLSPVSPPWVYLADFRGGLHERGLVEGQKVTIEYRYADNQRERLPTLAAELVRLPVDVLVAHTTPSTAAAQQATTTIPIVFMAISDPVGQGFVASLAQPGANLTGTSDFGVALSGKRLELLRESVPGTGPMAVLRPVSNPASALEWRATEDAARALGVELHVLDVRGADDLPGAFDAARRADCTAMLVLTDSGINTNLPQIVSLAASIQLPVMYFQRAHAAGGGLMAYGPKYPDLYRRAGYYIDRILKGAKPADLPVEQPATFDFFVNSKTAETLGLTIPHHILLQATEVIH
jgi:putative tryptophan/tyrosine transport system substrate-binding protein